jgi:hypothetical protein
MPLEPLFETTPVDDFSDDVFAGALGAVAGVAGDSEAGAGAPFVLAEGGTGSVDAAGLVLLAGVALVSCAGT